MLRIIFAIFLLTFLIITSCNKNKVVEDSRLIASVYEKKLYEKDLKGLFTEDISKEDSLQIIKSYIDKWVRKQLLLEKAELNLSPGQKDVEKQLDDYRSSLLIYKYEQQWIKQNLDTVVNDDEIQEYYDLYSSNFVLEDNIVKALFIKVPNISPNLNQVKQWYKSDKKDELIKLEAYCFEFCKKYDNFNEEWIPFSTIIKEIPFDIGNQDNFLRRRKYIETKDSIYSYYIYIKEYKLKNDISPLSFITENIKQIIINKRKLQLINELENNIYNDALNHGYYKIYN